MTSTDTYDTAAQAIERSISHNEIAWCDADDANTANLRLWCEDSVAANDGVTEYWGTLDGAEWRVHVRA